MSDSEAVIDAAVLDDLRGSVDGDRSFVVELIETYLADGAACVDAIGSAVEVADANALVRPAHTLKSSSATLGAARLATLARELEMIGRSGAMGADARDLVAGLRAAWPATAEAFRAWVERGRAG